MGEIRPFMVFGVVFLLVNVVFIVIFGEKFVKKRILHILKVTKHI